MARKKRKPDAERRNRPDRRALEGVMQQVVAGLRGQAHQDSPLGQAQALLYRAFEEPNEQRRVQLAQAALQTSPDCADAYVLLAEQARSRKEPLRLYEQGVAAGERALGADVFQRAVGHFWGILETRPYMRARLGLAHALWTAGRRDEAVPHLQDMLRLNPGDNQGVRYTLAGFLLFLDRDQELAWELELMEGCLRAVPEFVSRHQQDDPAKEEFTVPVACGQLKLALSWVVETGVQE